MLSYMALEELRFVSKEDVSDIGLLKKERGDLINQIQEIRGERKSLGKLGKPKSKEDLELARDFSEWLDERETFLSESLRYVEMSIEYELWTSVAMKDYCQREREEERRWMYRTTLLNLETREKDSYNLMLCYDKRIAYFKDWEVRGRGVVVRDGNGKHIIPMESITGFALIRKQERR